jgi:exodeoxyribonuclease V alpha subunit
MDVSKVDKWITNYAEHTKLSLSEEQYSAVKSISQNKFSILTGGPGCGKTTTTKAVVALFQAIGNKVVLCAPTGRAAQRMSEVIGAEAKTIHRLLQWNPSSKKFMFDEEMPLGLDVLIIDECSMLDVHLAAALLRAAPMNAQVLFIGDADQLPSVGPGNILQDLIAVESVPSFKLLKIFRQAQESQIIRYAHEVNKGSVPKIPSLIHEPGLLKLKNDCLFADVEEVTKEQLQYIQKAQWVLKKFPTGLVQKEEALYRQECSTSELLEPVLKIPEKLKHIDVLALGHAESYAEQLRLVLKSIHPWSALNYGLSAQDTIARLCTKTIPEYYGKQMDIQVLTPQVRGSLGTLQINVLLQQALNPKTISQNEFKIGDKIFRCGDRVIQTKNNYDLGVFNGDIGFICEVDTVNNQCVVEYSRDQYITYTKDDLLDLQLAYAITIHKSQGSEFDAVIIPIFPQHFNMLYRNLIYTAMTRAKKVCIFVGSRKALALAVKQLKRAPRQTALQNIITNNFGAV